MDSILLGDDAGKVWKSTNNGSSWTAIRTDTKYWSALASNADGSVLLAGAYSERNLYISTDGGSNWTDTGLSGNWTSAAITPDGSVLIALGDGQYSWISTDGGSTWNHLHPNTHGWGVGAISSDGQKIVLAVWSGDAFFTSNQGGSWTTLDPKGGSATGSWAYIAAASDFSVILLGEYNGRIYRSINDGATWAETQPKGNNNGIWLFTGASSNDGYKIIAGDLNGRLYISIDRGSTWSETQPAGPNDKAWQSAGVNGDGSVLFAGIEAGRVYLSIDGGTIWSETQPDGNTDHDWRSGCISRLLLTPISYFSSSSVADGNNVTSIVDRGSLVSKIQSIGADTYFDTTSEIGPVYVYYTHQDGRQMKRIIHDTVNHQAAVSWSSNAHDGTWAKTRIKAFDKDGATTEILRADISATEDLTHSGGVTNLNIS